MTDVVRKQVIEVEIQADGVEETLKGVDATLDGVGASAKEAVKPLESLEDRLRRLIPSSRAAVEQLQAQRMELERMRSSERADLMPKFEAHMQKFGIAGSAAKEYAEQTRAVDKAQQAAIKSASGFGLMIGGAVATGLLALAKNAINAADQIKTLSERTDLGYETVQRFGYAAKKGGSDLETVAKSVTFMSNALADGKKATLERLNEVGLSIDRLRSMRPDEAFLDIADAIKRIPDPAKQTQTALDLLGGSADRLLPSIRNGFRDVADSAHVMTDETVRRLSAAKETWQDFANDVTIWSAEILSSLLKVSNAPATTRPTTTVNPFAPGGFNTAIVMPQAVKEVVDPEPVKESAKAIEDWTAKLRAARAEIAALAPSTRRQIEDALEMGQKMDSLADQYHLSADAAAIFKDVVREQANASREAARESEKYREAVANINAQTSDLSASMRAQIHDLLERGKAEADVAKVLKVRAEYVRMVAREEQAATSIAKTNADMRRQWLEAGEKVHSAVMKQEIADLTSVNKQTRDNLLETSKLTEDTRNREMSLALSSYDYQIYLIDQWAKNQKDAFFVSTKETEAYFAAIDKNVRAKKLSVIDPSSVQGLKDFVSSLDVASELVSVLGQNASGAGRDVIAMFAGGIRIADQYTKSMIAARLETNAVQAASMKAAAATQMAWGAVTMGIGFAVSMISQVRAETKAYRAEVSRLSDELRELGESPISREQSDAQYSFKGKPNFRQAHLDALQQQIDDYHDRLDGLDKLVDGFARRVDAYGGKLVSSLDEYVDKTRDAEEMAKRLNEAVASGDEDRVKSLIEEASQLQSEIDVLVAGIDSSAVQAQQGFDRMGQYAIATFGSVLAETGSIYEAWSAVKDPVADLIRLQDELGLTSSETVQQFLDMQRTLSNFSSELEGLDAVRQMVEGVSQAGLFTADFARAAGDDVQEMFDRFREGGMSAEQSLAMVAPTLQQLWESSERYGVSLDDNTQALIDQARAQNLVGEDQKDVNVQILDVLKSIADVFGADLPDSAGETQRSIGGIRTELESVDFDRFKTRGIDAMESVRESAKHLVIGRSPGLIHVESTLRDSIDAAREFKAQGGDAMESVRRTVAELSQEEKTALDYLLEQRESVQDIADGMQLAIESVRQYAKEWERAKREQEAAAKLAEKRAQDRQNFFDFEREVGRDVARLSVQDDQMRRLIDLQFQRQDEMTRLTELAWAAGAGPEHLQLVTDMLEEKYRLMTAEVMQEATRAATTSLQDISALLEEIRSRSDDEIRSLTRYSSAGAFYDDVVSRVQGRTRDTLGGILGMAGVNGGVSVTVGTVNVGDALDVTEDYMIHAVGQSIVDQMKAQGVRFTSRG